MRNETVATFFSPDGVSIEATWVNQAGQSAGKGCFGTTFPVTHCRFINAKSSSTFAANNSNWPRVFTPALVKVAKTGSEHYIKNESAIFAKMYGNKNVASNKFAILMPHFPGKTLESLLSAENDTKTLLTPSQSLRTCVLLLKAVLNLSSKEIIHRDIKPEQVIVNVDENSKQIRNLKLIDFGFSYEPSISDRGALKRNRGTLSYLSSPLLLSAMKLKTIEEPDIVNNETYTVTLILAHLLTPFAKRGEILKEREQLIKQSEYTGFRPTDSFRKECEKIPPTAHLLEEYEHFSPIERKAVQLTIRNCLENPKKEDLSMLLPFFQTLEERWVVRKSGDQRALCLFHLYRCIADLTTFLEDKFRRLIGAHAQHLLLSEFQSLRDQLYEYYNEPSTMGTGYPECIAAHLQRVLKSAANELTPEENITYLAPIEKILTEEALFQAAKDSEWTDKIESCSLFEKIQASDALLKGLLRNSAHDSFKLEKLYMLKSSNYMSFTLHGEMFSETEAQSETIGIETSQSNAYQAKTLVQKWFNAADISAIKKITDYDAFLMAIKQGHFTKALLTLQVLKNEVSPFRAAFIGLLDQTILDLREKAQSLATKAEYDQGAQLKMTLINKLLSGDTENQLPGLTQQQEQLKNIETLDNNTLVSIAHNIIKTTKHIENEIQSNQIMRSCHERYIAPLLRPLCDFFHRLLGTPLSTAATLQKSKHSLYGFFAANKNTFNVTGTSGNLTALPEKYSRSIR